MKPIRFISNANAEFEEALIYYGEQEPGLDLKFLEQLRSTLTAIQQNPGAFGRYDDETRMKLVSRFPFIVFYHESPDEIIVLAIAHAARRPGYWKESGKES